MIRLRPNVVELRYEDKEEYTSLKAGWELKTVTQPQGDGLGRPSVLDKNAQLANQHKKAVRDRIGL